MDMLQKLIKSQPFIYLINGKYYLISSSTCQECTEENAIFAKEFFNAANKMISLHDCITLWKTDIESYNKLYDELKHKDQQSTQTSAEVGHELEKLLCLAKNKVGELENIQKQYENLVTLLWLQTEIEAFESAEKKVIPSNNKSRERCSRLLL